MVPGRLWLILRMLPPLAGVALTASCNDSQEKSQAMVLDAGYRFTIEDFLKAAAEGRSAVVQQFLAMGMHVDAANTSGQTALRIAAGVGHAHLVRQLLAAGASVDQADAAGVTPLMAAAQVGDGVSVQALRNAGAQTSRVDMQGHNALAAAAAGGHSGVVDLLVPETAGALDEVLLLACTAGHTGVIDGLLKANQTGTRAGVDWAKLLKAASSGGHLPAVRLLTSRMPSPAETASPPGAASVSEAEENKGGSSIPDAATTASQQIDSTILPATELPTEPTSQPISMVLPSTPARLGGARFTRVDCEAMATVPEIMRMIAWEPQAWPVILQDVAPEHQSASVLLTADPPHTVTLKVGDEIPGTDCVVEKLRRRRLYTDAAESVLKNMSELHFRRAGTSEVFKAMAGEQVLSNHSSAVLRITGVDRVLAAVPGDEFRLGSLLLRVSSIASGAIKLENRLTREIVSVPLTAIP